MEFVFSGKNPDASVAFASFSAMHTVLEMVMANVPEQRARDIAASVERLVLDIESKLGRHSADQVFARINASGGHSAVAVDEEIYSILQLCEVFRKNTCGYFDISALSPVRTVPAYRLENDGKKVCLSGEDVVLDAGGFGKGYALDRVRSLLVESGVSDAMLNFGDSSVLGLGRHPYGDGWRAGTARGGSTFLLKDSAISVSGLSAGEVPHIVDPATGEMVDNGGPVVVEGRSAFICEVLSTALYAAPREMREKVAGRFEGYFFKVV